MARGLGGGCGRGIGRSDARVRGRGQIAGRVGGGGGGVRNPHKLWVCCFGSCTRYWSGKMCLIRHYKLGTHGHTLKKRCGRCYNNFRTRSDLSQHIQEGHIGHVPVSCAIGIFGKRRVSQMNLGPNELRYLSAMGLSSSSSSSSSAST